MDVSERFWNAPLADFKNGYIDEAGCCTCLICGQEYEKGRIYADGENLYEASLYIRVHINQCHGPVFMYLLGLDKKFSGLTDHQKSLLRLFYQGKSDTEVQQEMGIGSASTIRNHRFVLKEKERQARVFLAMMELLKEKGDYAPEVVEIHKTATMVDDRYNITQEETAKILKKLFPEGLDGRLTTFYLKEKQKVVVMRELMKRFEAGRIYTEKEIDAVLKDVYEDYVTIRRCMIDYGFLDRKNDGSQYWVKE